MTLCLLSFNQELYIRRAIESAFSQNYKQLEIILSDDNSSDNTFSIMEEMAATYNGPHSIIINRNTKNLGTCQHLNRVFELANGEIFVFANGDDFSENNRVQLIYDEYYISEKKARSFISNYTVINEHDIITKGSYFPSHPLTYDRFIHRCWYAHGATLAIHREVYDFFGNLDYGLHEDQILMHRSLLLGNVVYMPKKLVNYRRHELNVSGSTYNYKDSSKKYIRLIRSEIGIIIGSDKMLIDFIYWCDRYSFKPEVFKIRGINKLKNRLNYGVSSLNLFTSGIFYLIPFLVVSLKSRIPLNLTLRKISYRIKIFTGSIKRVDISSVNVFDKELFR